LRVASFIKWLETVVRGASLSKVCARPQAIITWLAVVELVSLSNVFTAWAIVCSKVMNKLQDLSNVVSPTANARLLGVGSRGRARDLLQKPALPPGKVGWRNFDWPQLLNQKA